jgi:hypothetical protein
MFIQLSQNMIGHHHTHSLAVPIGHAQRLFP